MVTALPLPLAPQLLLAATDGGGMGDIRLRMMDMLIQVKEGPEGLGRKNFKIWTRISQCKTKRKIKNRYTIRIRVSYGLI
jgi:hypothetical protein